MFYNLTEIPRGIRWQKNLISARVRKNSYYKRKTKRVTSLPASISVVMPVHNAAALFERAIGSVCSQTFPDWELLVVDDASTDDSLATITAWAEKDARIRLFRLDENRGASTARNMALENARGEIVCYLDHDDEYYPDYLANVARHRDKAEVLVLGYDFAYEDGPAGSRPPSWDPGAVREYFFVDCIVTPLGVAHRRSLALRVGGFNESLWRERRPGSVAADGADRGGICFPAAEERDLSCSRGKPQPSAAYYPAAERGGFGELAEWAGDF